MDATETIQNRANDLTYDLLITDKVLFGGLVYYTLIIGEAAYNLTKAFKQKHTETEWSKIEKMRHNLVHGYYNVDPEILWSVIQNDIPVLRQQVTNYLADTDWEEWEKSAVVIKETTVHKSLIQTATRMKNRGYDIDEICKITGLNRDEINRL
ncbi:MAG: DUF86 domain-containing protein [Bacteroidales bacterium]|nr:DUF86 domain-containing protein [Bacteroidales bacterium]